MLVADAARIRQLLRWTPAWDDLDAIAIAGARHLVHGAHGLEMLSAIGTVVILYFGSTMVLDDTLTVGVMVAFIGYLSSFFDPIQSLSQLYNTFQSAMAAAASATRSARASRARSWPLAE